MQAPGAAGQVVAHALGLVADGVGIEQHEVGVEAGRDAPPVAHAVQPGGDVGDPVDRLLEREHAVLAHAVGQQRRAVDRAAHHVEVRAGVGAADQRPGVTPHLGAELPVGLVVLEP
jgi:hypothetical protein